MRVPKSGFGLVAGASAATAIIALAPSSGLRDVGDKGFCANSYSFIPMAQAGGTGAGASPCAVAMAVAGETEDQPGPAPAPPLQPGQTHCSSSHVHTPPSDLHYTWTANHWSSTNTHAKNSDVHLVGTTTEHCDDGPIYHCDSHTPLSTYHTTPSMTYPPGWLPWPEDFPFHNPVSHTHESNSDYHYTSSQTHRSNSDYHESNSDYHAVNSTSHTVGSTYHLQSSEMP